MEEIFYSVNGKELYGTLWVLSVSVAWLFDLLSGSLWSRFVHLTVNLGARLRLVKTDVVLLVGALVSVLPGLAWTVLAVVVLARDVAHFRALMVYL